MLAAVVFAGGKGARVEGRGARIVGEWCIEEGRGNVGSNCGALW